MILIVASEWDPHADAVVVALNQLSFDDIVRIDFETAADRYDLVIRPASNGAEFQSRHSGHGLEFPDGAKTIWWRRANCMLSMDQLHNPRAKEVDQVETYWACRWWIESLAEVRFPLGHPSRHRAASNKLLQLRVAKALGFTVPGTIFSNDRKQLLEFASKYDEVVLKPLNITTMIDEETGAPRGFKSRAISKDAFFALCHDSTSTIAFCQNKIAKVADIRLTVLPSIAVACKISTDDLVNGEVDWRQTTLQRKHELIELPPDLEARCRAYLAQLQLSWGAFDFGLSEDGEWTFFECNPNGQWLWIERKTGAQLAGHFAQGMLDHHAASTPA